jgi:hypothetical protein
MIKEVIMNEINTLNQRYETIAWGAFFVLLGVLFFVPGPLLPYGIGMLGIGVILLGLNLARSLSHIPVRGFSVTLGLLALLEGAVSLLRALVGIQLKLPFFPLLLIVIGAILLVRAATRMKSATTIQNG